MIVEQVAKNKNTVTIIAFILVCIVLNLENLAIIFHFTIPIIIRDYGHFFPLLFVAVVFLQKKSHRLDINNEELWEVKRKKALHINNTKSILRYIMVAGVGFIFLFSNIYNSGQEISGNNRTILFALAFMIVISLIYNYFKKGFHVGFCNQGILYGYSSKVMLIIWEDLTDFEMDQNSKTITVYCNKKLSIQKITLKNQEHFNSLKTLVMEKLTYKNVTKLLTDD